jgi:hypothetical protein
MRVTFQGDANLDARIVCGLKRRLPEVDFRTAEEAILVGLADPDVLRLAAESGRILVTHDHRTMPSHFEDFICTRSSPGVIIVSKQAALAAVIDDLLLIWCASQAEEWQDRLIWIPL